MPKPTCPRHRGGALGAAVTTAVTVLLSLPLAAPVSALAVQDPGSAAAAVVTPPQRAVALARVAEVKGLPKGKGISALSPTVAAADGQVETTFTKLRAVVRGPHAAKIVKRLRITVLRGAKKGSKTTWTKVDRSRSDKKGRFDATFTGQPDKTYQFRLVVRAKGLRPYSGAPFKASLDEPELLELGYSKISHLVLSPDGSFLTYSLPEKKQGKFWHDSVGVHDVASGVTTVVDPLPAGVVPNGDVSDLSLSPNRRYVAFWSDATNLTADADLNFAADAFVKDLTTGVVNRVNLGPWGTMHGGSARSGDKIAWSPDSSTIALNGGEARYQIWSYRLADGTSHIVSDAGCSTEVEGFTPDGLNVISRAFDGATTRAVFSSVDGSLSDGSSSETIPFATAGDTAPLEPGTRTTTLAQPAGQDLVFVRAWRWTGDWGDKIGNPRWALWKPSTGVVVRTGPLTDPYGYGLKQGRYFLQSIALSTHSDVPQRLQVTDIQTGSARELSLVRRNEQGLSVSPIDTDGLYEGVRLADVSPDGRLFAYAAQRLTPTRAERLIVLRNLDTGHEVEIANASMPVFVGNRLAVVRDEQVVVLPPVEP